MIEECNYSTNMKNKFLLLFVTCCLLIVSACANNNDKEVKVNKETKETKETSSSTLVKDNDAKNKEEVLENLEGNDISDEEESQSDLITVSQLVK